MLSRAQKILGLGLVAFLTACSGGGGSSSQVITSASFGGPDGHRTVLNKDKARDLYKSIPSKVTSLCGKAMPKISEHLLRTYDQKGSNWCSVFSTSRLLEEHQLRNKKTKVEVSINDLAARGLDEYAIGLYRYIPHLRSLERVQESGKILKETSLPYDAGLFELKIFEGFLSYFKSGTDLGKIQTQHYTIDTNQEFLRAQKSRAKRVNDFMFNLSIPVEELTLNAKNQIKEYIDVDEFNFREEKYDSESFADGIESLLISLAKGRTMTMGFCGQQMDKFANPQKNIDPNICGAHAVNIVSSRIENGKCELQVLNSWGNRWGEAGHRWIELEKLVEWLPENRNNGNVELVTLSLSDREPGDKVGNVIVRKTEEFFYRGETQYGHPHGSGILKSKENTFYGSFKSGLPQEVRGTMTMLQAIGPRNVKKVIYKGRMSYDEKTRNVQPNGKGEFRFEDNRPMFIGETNMGLYVKGTFTQYQPNNQLLRSMEETGEWLNRQFKKGTRVRFNDKGEELSREQL